MKPEQTERWCEHNKNIAGVYTPCNICQPNPEGHGEHNWMYGLPNGDWEQLRKIKPNLQWYGCKCGAFLGEPKR